MPKRTTQQCLSLDIRLLQKAGALEVGAILPWAWYHNGEMYAARLTVGTSHGIQLRGIEELLDRPGGPARRWIAITRTPCNLGGERAWWRCSQCDRRIAIVYEDEGSWACRHCLRLTYASQSERPTNRAHRQANKIRRRLGWKVGIAYPNGGRPKGMHVRTFEHWVEKHERYAEIARADLLAWWMRYRRTFRKPAE